MILPYISEYVASLRKRLENNRRWRRKFGRELYLAQGVIRKAEARIAELEAKLAEAHGALRDAAENGLIYWEPRTQRGHAEKAKMRARIAETLASPGTEAAAVLEAAVAIAARLVECTEEDYHAATKLKDAVDAYLAKRGRT